MNLSWDQGIIEFPYFLRDERVLPENRDFFIIILNFLFSIGRAYQFCFTSEIINEKYLNSELY